MADSRINIVIQATDKASTPIKDVNRSLRDMDRTSTVASSSTSVLGSIASKAFTAIKVAAVVAGVTLGALSKNALESAGDYEQSRVAFETMLGSADKARQMLADLSSFARSTPFELPEVVSGAKQLLAYGFAQQELIPTMRRLGDLAAGLHVPFEQVALAYGQVHVKGHLMGQETLQFTNAGIPLIQTLAKTMGKSTDEIYKMQEAGQISFGDVQTAIESLTDKGSQFGGMMKKQSSTFDGTVSNIKDGFGQILRAAAGITPQGDIIKDSFFDRIKDGANGLMKAMQRVDLKAVTKTMGDFAKVLGDVWDNAQPVIEAVGDYLTPKFDGLWNVVDTKLFPALKKLWTDVLEPLMPVVGTLLVGAIGLAIDAFSFLVSVVSDAVNIFSDLWKEAENGNPIVWGLIGILGTLAAALALSAAFSAFSAGFAVITGTVIPGAIASFGTLSALVASPIVMPAIAIGAALAAIAVVYTKTQELIDLIHSVANDIQNTKDEGAKTDAAIKKLYAEGKISNEQLQTYLSNTEHAAEQTKTNMYGGFFGPLNRSLDNLFVRITGTEKQFKGSGFGGFASGTPYAPGGLTLVGERGPELVSLPRGSQVTQAWKTREMASGGAVGGGRTAPIVGELHVHNEVDIKNLLSDIGWQLRAA